MKSEDKASWHEFADKLQADIQSSFRSNLAEDLEVEDGEFYLKPGNVGSSRDGTKWHHPSQMRGAVARYWSELQDHERRSKELEATASAQAVRILELEKELSLRSEGHSSTWWGLARVGGAFRKQHSTNNSLCEENQSELEASLKFDVACVLREEVAAKAAEAACANMDRDVQNAKLNNYRSVVQSLEASKTAYQVEFEEAENKLIVQIELSRELQEDKEEKQAQINHIQALFRSCEDEVAAATSCARTSNIIQYNQCAQVDGLTVEVRALEEELASRNNRINDNMSLTLKVSNLEEELASRNNRDMRNLEANKTAYQVECEDAENKLMAQIELSRQLREENEEKQAKINNVQVLFRGCEDEVAAAASCARENNINQYNQCAQVNDLTLEVHALEEELASQNSRMDDMSLTLEARILEEELASRNKTMDGMALTLQVHALQEELASRNKSIDDMSLELSQCKAVDSQQNSNATVTVDDEHLIHGGSAGNGYDSSRFSLHTESSQDLSRVRTELKELEQRMCTSEAVISQMQEAAQARDGKLQHEESVVGNLRGKTFQIERQVKERDAAVAQLELSSKPQQMELSCALEQVQPCRQEPIGITKQKSQTCEAPKALPPGSTLPSTCASPGETPNDYQQLSRWPQGLKNRNPTMEVITAQAFNCAGVFPRTAPKNGNATLAAASAIHSVNHPVAPSMSGSVCTVRAQSPPIASGFRQPPAFATVPTRGDLFTGSLVRTRSGSPPLLLKWPMTARPSAVDASEKRSPRVNLATVARQSSSIRQAVSGSGASSPQPRCTSGCSPAFLRGRMRERIQTPSYFDPRTGYLNSCERRCNA